MTGEHLGDKRLCKISTECEGCQFAKEDIDTTQGHDGSPQASCELLWLGCLGHHRHDYPNALVAHNSKADGGPHTLVVISNEPRARTLH